MNSDQILITLCLLLFPLSIAAQDLRLDQAFFEKEAKTYQSWLENSGIGEYLKVRELEVEEKQLTLYLEFHFQELDSIIRAWEFLKSEFENKHAISLEQQLFFKFQNLMEIRQSSGRIGIFDTYDLREEPLFVRGIYYKEGKFVVEDSGHKDQVRKIKFSPQKLLGEKNKMSVAEFNENCPKGEIFNIIHQFSEKHFTKEDCFDFPPKVRLLEKDEVLRFKAIDLCRQVLPPSADTPLKKILSKIGFDLSFAKREKLDILVVYEEQEKGFNIHVTIDGKYGSGLYSQVGRSGYNSMEGDFNEYLVDYADEFKELLRQEILEKCF